VEEWSSYFHHTPTTVEIVMSYLPTWIVVVVGLLVLGWVLVRVVRHVRRFNRSASVAGAHFGHETGMLRARSAALRVAMRETRARVKHAPADVPSNSRGRQEEDRG
jgi:hypothetical protein